MNRSRRRHGGQSAAVIAQARRSMKSPVARPGTVIAGGSTPTVQMDDGSVAYGVAIGEMPAVGQRVTVEFWPPHVAYVTGIYGGAVRMLGKVVQVDEQPDITTEVDMFDLRVTVPILSPGREIQVWTKVYCEASAADTGAQTKVVDDAGEPVGDESGRTAQAYVPVAGGNFMLTGFVSETPDVGERTYQVTITRVGGAGTVTALCENTRAELIVRDIGPAVLQ